jgi:hypothetical protein
MLIKRITEQNSETLIEFYEKLRLEKPVHASKFERMIYLVQVLDAYEDDRPYWAYTLDEAIIITNVDAKNPGLSITPIVSKDSVLLQYPMQREKAPFKGALVEIEANTHDDNEAACLIIQALDYTDFRTE